MGIVRHLIVEEYGTFVGKHSERLQVERIKTREKLQEAPLMHLETVLIATRGASISADAVAACAGGGIPIHFLSSHGQPYAALYSSGLAGTVETRRPQLTALAGPLGLELAKGMTTGKIRNQATLLKYMAKYRKEKDPALYEEVRLLAGEVADHEEELRRLPGETLRRCASTCSQPRAGRRRNTGRPWAGCCWPSWTGPAGARKAPRTRSTRP